MLLINSFDNIFVMDNLYPLRIFAHISKTLNFTESARQLHLAQPAISRHIKSLEAELGRSLFLRQKKRIQLTQAGREFLVQISPLLSEFDRIVSDFNLEKITVAGVLKVGSISEAGTYIYMDHLIRFQKEFPQIEIRIEFASSDQLLQKISNGDLDFALVSRFMPAPAVESFTMFRDHPVLVG
jgi:DNA-binding transcriptional LysR family regulator